MKTFTKVVASIAAVLICLGLIVGVVGLTMGAPWNALTYGGWASADDFTETYKDVKKLDFEFGLAQVTFQEGAAFSIETQGLRIPLTSEVEGGTWKIRTKDNHRGWNWGGWRSSSPKVTITLPKDFVADQLKLEIGMGSVYAGTLRVKGEADLKIGMGEMDLGAIAAREVDIDCGMGSLTAGAVESADIKVECGMGNVDLSVKGEEADYGYKVKVGMGSVYIGGNNHSGIGQDRYHNTSAANMLDIDCGMGNVNIQFQ